MKKLYVLLVVVALVFVSSMVSAADVTVGGSMDIRSRNFDNLDFNKDHGDKTVDTQERVRLDVNVKAGDVKGKVTLENNWDAWGRFEQPQADSTTTTDDRNKDKARLDFREAWMLFPVPNTPIYVKGGHMLLQLGNGWFFRSLKFGSDAWVAYTDLDALHLGVVNVKAWEGASGKSDDVDAYVFLATMKVGDTMKFGADVTYANDRYNTLGFGNVASGSTPTTVDATQAYNVGVNADVKVGPVGLKAEVDVQTGKVKANGAKIKGNQVVLEGNVALDPVTVNFTIARGSGDKIGNNDINRMLTFTDNDPYYTFLYEYKIAGPCGLHTGFCNTTALGGGAVFAATKNLSVGGNLWFLQATEKVADVTSTTGDTTNDLGMEVDVKINWKLADNLTWNWNLGYLDPGKGLGKDPATGIQGVLSMKF